MQFLFKILHFYPTWKIKFKSYLFILIQQHKVSQTGFDMYVTMNTYYFVLKFIRICIPIKI